MKQPSFPEFATTSLADLFEQARFPENTDHLFIALVEIASRWHDPNCECRYKGVVEKETCLRCANVRRQILERL